MPELPEMTAYREKIAGAFEGATLVECEFTPDCKLDAPAEAVTAAIRGAQLSQVERNGKELFLHFATGDTVAVHLMLGGRFNVAPIEDEPPDTRVATFKFDNGKALYVRDRDAWARIKFNPEAPKAPDALSSELNAEYLKKRLARSRKAIKAFLTDQDRVRGIGNAYSDEILWASRVAPQSTCNKVPDEAVEALAEAIHEVLAEAVENVCALDDPSDYRKARLRDLKVHNHTREFSPGGAKIQTGEVSKSKTYFTDEQVLYS
ncbi:MAG: DNA-formamidopyrimidine glycosylase family protein [Solirubrobacterales bacterium]